MSDLTDLRDHARRLSTADHRDDCEAVWHEATWSGLIPTRREKPNPHCGGCMPEGERLAWGRIAVELEDYLGAGDDGPGLFEEGS